MVVERKNSISLRCPSCGSLSAHRVHIFNFSGGHRVDCICPCGQKKAVIGTEAYREYWMLYLCAICEEEHFLDFHPHRFWSQSPQVICCPHTGVKLGVMGPEELELEGEERYREELEALIDQMGCEDYFVNPVVMLDILDLVQDFAAQGQVLCLCSSRDIHIDLFPDRVKLICGDCSGQLILPACTRDDLDQVIAREILYLIRQMKSMKNSP